MTTTLPQEQSFTLQSYAMNLDASLKFADMLVKTQLVPAQFKKSEEVVACILYGQELGFSPMQALQSLDVIQGKVTLNTNAIKALILQSGGTIETIEWNDKKCTLKGTRNKRSEIITFSMEDASLMLLTTKDNWKKMPKLMLYARCVSILARNLWADLLKGFYSSEEIEDSDLITEPKNITPILPSQESIKKIIETTSIKNHEKWFYIPNATREQTTALEEYNLVEHKIMEIDKDGIEQEIRDYWCSIDEVDPKLLKKINKYQCQKPIGAVEIMPGEGN